MAKCPKCGIEIDYLEWKCYKMTHGELCFEGIKELCGGDDAIYFFCPTCEEKLFENETEVAQFLKTNNELVGRK